MRDLSLEHKMPAGENARSGSILAGRTVSKKLYACCVHSPLFPPPENKEISFLTIDVMSGHDIYREERDF